MFINLLLKNNNYKESVKYIKIKRITFNVIIYDLLKLNVKLTSNISKDIMFLFEGLYCPDNRLNRH